MLKYQHISIILLFLLAIAAGPAWSIGVGDAVPDFRLETLDGKQVGLADYKGKKPLMILFWATWCPACREEVPQVNRIASELGPRGLEVLAINVGVNDSAAKARAYRDRHRLGYQVAFDQGSRVSRAFGVFGTPTVLVIDRKGIVRYQGSEAPQDLAERFARLKE